MCRIWQFGDKYFAIYGNSSFDGEILLGEIMSFAQRLYYNRYSILCSIGYKAGVSIYRFIWMRTPSVRG